jgi:rubrerythrin
VDLEKHFQNVRRLEEDMMEMYNELLDELSDPDALQVLRGIRDEEIVHIQLAKSLIAIVQRPR